MYTIPFNRASFEGNEIAYMMQAIASGHAAGDGSFTRKCHAFLEQELGVRKALLTTSCTHALEMAALLLDIRPGDEVIVPAFTFVSSVNVTVNVSTVPWMNFPLYQSVANRAKVPPSAIGKLTVPFAEFSRPVAPRPVAAPRIH